MESRSVWYRILAEIISKFAWCSVFARSRGFLNDIYYFWLFGLKSRFDSIFRILRSYSSSARFHISCMALSELSIHADNYQGQGLSGVMRGALLSVKRNFHDDSSA